LHGGLDVDLEELVQRSRVGLVEGAEFQPGRLGRMK
jgi:hypothetical protein